MRSLKTIPLAFLPILLVNTSAIPQPATEQGCVVPLGIFNTLDKPFTLSALIPDLNSLTRETTIPVRIDPFTPNEKTASKPIISRAKIASTKFTLKDNKLIAADFEASLLPTTKIFPPPPQGFEFSVDTPVAPAKFRASYACDNNGALFLELRDSKVFFFFFISLEFITRFYFFSFPRSRQANIWLKYAISLLPRLRSQESRRRRTNLHHPQTILG